VLVPVDSILEILVGMKPRDPEDDMPLYTVSAPLAVKIHYFGK